MHQSEAVSQEAPKFLADDAYLLGGQGHQFLLRFSAKLTVGLGYEAKDELLWESCGHLGRLEPIGKLCAQPANPILSIVTVQSS